MIIDGFEWFIAAIAVFVLHAAYLFDWQRESRARLAEWSKYDAASQKRHVEFMAEFVRYRHSQSGRGPRGAA